ncbi:MAG: hypothetical protein GF383_08835 [Candidatus Lokiarchaeota archaeon]|nr:hypothetical protein [Candidatus Lokiarchaeota archaeon]
MLLVKDVNIESIRAPIVRETNAIIISLPLIFVSLASERNDSRANKMPVVKKTQYK